MTIHILTLIILDIITSGMGAIEMPEFECGVTDFTRALISKGTRTDRGEWPFLAALYYVEEYTFFCGGTLITYKHVLTAAHCVNQKHIQSKLLPADVIVLLGAYDLTSKIERGVIQRDVEEINVHPDWRVYSEKYDADLAILVLTESVKFTNYIQPVCMPADNATIDEAGGSVVGWGLTEIGRKPNKAFIKHAFIKTLNDSYCYTTDPHAAVISSTRTFCGRGEDGNPNNGDSGGGFYILYGSAWVQHGIVSALRTNATGYVDGNSVVVYTNVREFKSWIVEIVTQSGEAVGEAKIHVDIFLECLYSFTVTELKYSCVVDNLDIQSENFAVAYFTGVHQNQKTDQDVELIQFRNGTMFFIPSGIEKVFTNLRGLEVNANLSTKLIRRSNFKNLKNLVHLNIQENDIDTLDDECLKDLSNLEYFSLVNNNLKEISETVFLTNTKLRVVELYTNRLEVIPRNVFRNNVLLEKVFLNGNFLTFIDERTFETNIKLKKVYLNSNQLEILPRHLFRKNLFLEKVSLEDNLLKRIDDTNFETNGKLSVMYLFSNQLEVLPRNLFKNNLLLEEVNLYNNSLTTIDEMIFETNDKLRIVFISFNQLEFLPRTLFRNNLLLEKVYLDENSLTTLDEASFETNGKLRKVHLDSNQLEVLPSNLFKNNVLLEIVGLGENFLKFIDETSFETNGKLSELYLYSNQLDVLPRNLFTNNVLLEIISLHNNSLKLIDARTFDTNAKLKEVWLHSNQLQALPRNVFKNNLLLEIVSLSDNFLKVIDEITFHTNLKLREVHLSSNKLEVLPKDVFKHNLFLEQVSLGENFLKIIEIDFTGFKNIKQLFFSDNVCINAYYEGDDTKKYLNQFRNLTEFQNLIRANCSSHKPLNVHATAKT